MDIKCLVDYGIKSLADIGANMGAFYNSARNILSLDHENCLLVEANKACEEKLKTLGAKYKIAMLSDSVKVLPYYMAKHDPYCTGNSYHKEMTHHYRSENLITEMIQTDTLDNIAFRNFDLIKLDTQGSELEILRGGLKTLANAKAVIIETSILQYNENSPLQPEVISFMTEYGFKVEKVLDETFRPNSIHQQDLLFVKI
jgi:hypothetical protein